jgi:Xaa-Pro dipeptidase
MQKKSLIPSRNFERSEFERRVLNIQKILIKRNVNILLLSSEADIRYFTGFMTQFWQSPTRPWFLLIKPEGAPIAIIPSIGVPLMEDCYVERIHSWSSPAEHNDGIGLLLNILKKEIGTKAGRLGLLMGRETSFRAPLLDIFEIQSKMGAVELVDLTSEIQRLRMIKSESEIEKIRYVCSLVSNIFDDLSNWVRPGLPLSELFRTFKIKALSAGVDDVSYLVGAANSGGYFDIIAPPNDTPLKTGDIFMLDTGCLWDGYFCDFDRNFALGIATDDAQAAHHKLIDATNAAATSIKPGVTKCKDLFYTMNRVLYPNTDKAFLEKDDVGRYGHGVGSQLTEPPSHTSWDNTTIESGMTLTLEPSINYGSQNFLMVAEENILVKETTIEFLSQPCDRDLKVIK